MNEEEKFIVQKAMVKYGGSFVKNLGRLILFADKSNLSKIKNTFSDYWNKYLEIGLEEEKKK